MKNVRQEEEDCKVKKWRSSTKVSSENRVQLHHRATISIVRCLPFWLHARMVKMLVRRTAPTFADEPCTMHCVAGVCCAIFSEAQPFNHVGLKRSSTEVEEQKPHKFLLSDGRLEPSSISFGHTDKGVFFSDSTG